MSVRFWMSVWVMAPVRGVSVRYVMRKREPLIIKLRRLLRGRDIEECENGHD